MPNNVPVRERGSCTIAHIGVRSDQPGGISQVIAEYLTWTSDEIKTVELPSTSGAGILGRYVLWLSCVVRLVGARLRCPRFAAVVHISQGGSFVREGLIMAVGRLLQINMAIHLHGSRFAQFYGRHPHLVARVLALADQVYVLTPETEAIVKEALPFRRSSDVVLVKNAVRVPEPAGRSKENVVLFAGEVGRRKGVPQLIAAWELLEPAHPDWTLVVAGPMSDRPPVDRGRRVRLAGPLPHVDVLDLQERAAIAVLPSRNEALPMFLLEAMARSCACVGTPVGGVPRLLAGDAGVVVAVDDVGGLADALDLLMRDPESREAVGLAGRRRVQAAYSSDAVFADIAPAWIRLATRSLP